MNKSGNSGNFFPPLGQTIKVRREKSGRGGKTVTVLFEFQATVVQREYLGKFLKKAMGTGGTVKSGRIELQGDCLEKALKELEKLGYKPKQAGG